LQKASKEKALAEEAHRRQLPARVTPGGTAQCAHSWGLERLHIDDVQQNWRTVAYAGLDDAGQGKTTTEELADSFMASWVGGGNFQSLSSANSGFVPNSFFTKYVFLEGISPSIQMGERQRREKRYKGVKCRFCVQDRIATLNGIANPWFVGIMVSDLSEARLRAHQQFHQGHARRSIAPPVDGTESKLLMGMPCCDLVLERGECPETEIARECYSGAVKKVRPPWSDEEALTASPLQPKASSTRFGAFSPFWHSPEAGSGGSGRTNELPAAHQHNDALHWWTVRS
jgi:hypothetical protein